MLARPLPQRLVDAILPPETARRKAAELSRAARQSIVDAVRHYTLTPTGVAGLQKAEACAGGVNTDEIDPHDMAIQFQKQARQDKRVLRQSSHSGLLHIATPFVKGKRQALLKHGQAQPGKVAIPIVGGD